MCIEYVQGHGNLWGFSINVCVKNISLEDQNSQLINIHEVMDFHGGFMAIFSALCSNTGWTIQLLNICAHIGNI